MEKKWKYKINKPAKRTELNYKSYDVVKEYKNNNNKITKLQNGVIWRLVYKHINYKTMFFDFNF